MLDFVMDLLLLGIQSELSRNSSLSMKEKHSNLKTSWKLKLKSMHITKILNIRPSVLFLHSISDVCTEITFLVHTFYVEKLVDLANKRRNEIKVISIESDYAQMVEYTRNYAE